MLRKARGATCRERFNLALEFNNLSGIANYAARQAWGFHPHHDTFKLKQFEARLEKAVEKSMRIDEKIRGECLR